MTYRVAMVAACPFPVPQGSQVLIRNTALALRDLGHDPHLVVYGYGVGADDCGLRTHRCVRIPGARRTAAGPSPAKPVLDLALVRTLRRVVARERIDVVHAHNYEGLLVALCAGKRPIVYHAHNAMADELPYFLRYGRRLGQWFDTHLPRRADHVIAPHERLAGYLVKCGCNPNRVSVIPPSCDATAFKAHAVSDAPPPVLYTGNLDAYQNLDLLVRAMRRVRESMPEARWLVATAERKRIPGAEMVFTLGPCLSDSLSGRHMKGGPAGSSVSLVDILAQDAVVACPRVSWSGYPMKILNAMSACKAVVACESCAYPLTHEVNGLVAPDNDDAAFADAVLQIIKGKQLRAKLGANARKTIEEHHNPESFAEQVAHIYSELLGH